MKDNTYDELNTRRYTNAIRDAYTLTEADSILQQLITKKVNEAERRVKIETKIDCLKTTHGHLQTGTVLDNDYFTHNITMLERELQSTQDGGSDE